MQLAVFVITFSVAIGLFVNFLAGAPGNRKLKAHLVEFYIAVEAGDWAALYQMPASALYNFMNHFLGERHFSIRYFIQTFKISLTATLFLFAVSFSYAYAEVLILGDRCPTPPLYRFLQIPLYMSDLLVFVVPINFVADYFTWSLSQAALGRISKARGRTPIIILLVAPIAMIALLFVLYAIYLPISIIVQMSSMGRHYDLQLFVSEFIFILNGNLANIFGLIALPREPFYLACTGRPHTQFMISYIQTFQILAIETIIPIALLLVSTIFGALVYWTRPLTQKPLGVIISRLDSSEKPVIAILAGGLAIIAGLLSALIAYLKN